MASIKDLQQLLKDTGYDPGAVDGIFGDKTLAACLEALGYESDVKNDYWKSIKYFRKSEFTCKCGCGLNNIRQPVVEALEAIREHFGKPLIVSSGCRCATHNAAVGGVPNSLHMEGCAADFTVSTVQAVKVIVWALDNLNPHYIYAINNDFVHIDFLKEE